VAGRDEPALRAALAQLEEAELLFELPPEEWTPSYADIASAWSGVM